MVISNKNQMMLKVHKHTNKADCIIPSITLHHPHLGRSDISEGRVFGRPSNSSGVQAGSWCIGWGPAPLRVTPLVANSVYLHSQFWTSVLKFCLCFLCVHSNPNVARSASPRGAPIPAPIAASLPEHDSDVLDTEELLDGDVNAAAVTVLVKVVVSVAVAGFGILVDVDPDVRFKITCALSRTNGESLPLVAVSQVLLLHGLQQNSHWSCIRPTRNRGAPPPGLTTNLASASGRRLGCSQCCDDKFKFCLKEVFTICAVLRTIEAPPGLIRATTPTYNWIAVTKTIAQACSSTVAACTCCCIRATWYVRGGSAVRIVARLRFSHRWISSISSQGVKCKFMFFLNFSKEVCKRGSLSKRFLWLFYGWMMGVCWSDPTVPPKQCSDVTLWQLRTEWDDFILHCCLLINVRR